MKTSLGISLLSGWRIKPSQTVSVTVAVLLLTARIAMAQIGGPVAHWTFDEAGGTIAHDSVGTNDGTLSAQGASFVTCGVSGNCLSVTQANNGYVDMGNVLAFTTNSFTTVAWIKTAPGYTTSNGGSVLSKHISTIYAGYFLDVNVTGGMGAPGMGLFYFANGSPHWVTSTNAVNDGGWHQIVGVHDVSGTSRIYVDGTPAQASTPSTVVVSNAAHFVIGGLTVGSTPTSSFTGLIDDVQVYDRALSDSEIQFLFENPGMTTGQQPLAIYTAVELVFPTQSNMVYQLQYQNNLGSTNWINLGEPFFGDGTTNSILQSTRLSGQRFYRLLAGNHQVTNSPF